MFEQQPEDPIKVLVGVADQFPLGLHEGHPAWKADGVLYALSSRKLIHPVGMCEDGALVYKATVLGETRIQEERAKAGN
jgi:hypothetical protein